MSGLVDFSMLDVISLWLGKLIDTLEGCHNEYCRDYIGLKC
jgi:hypothetical protein